jgi:hypothetical protein
LLAGRRFKLENPTLALDVVDGRRVAITLPRGAVVKVVAGPTGDGDRLVDVISEGRVVTVFAFDLTVRGTEIKDRTQRVSALRKAQGRRHSAKWLGWTFRAPARPVVSSQVASPTNSGAAAVTRELPDVIFSPSVISF